MNKQELEDSRNKAWSLALTFLIVIGIIIVAITLFPKDNKLYKQGFQDGQANATEEIVNMGAFEIKGYENNRVIWFTYYDEVKYRGVVCPEGYYINMTSPRNFGCVRK